MACSSVFSICIAVFLAQANGHYLRKLIGPNTSNLVADVGVNAKGAWVPPMSSASFTPSVYHAGLAMHASSKAVPAVIRAPQRQQQANLVRPPRVYFLFMAVDKIFNLDVWKAFFAQAPPDQYRAYVHCKLPSCVAQVAGSPLENVPTVPSYYCTDLVSPMNQLLAQALHHEKNEPGTPNPVDKFAFVSDSTLPAKPFSTLYSTLVHRVGSDFCIFPSREWADIPSAKGIELAAKHHQWVTLERAHAEKTSALWASGTMHNFMSRFRMNQLQWQFNNNSYGDSRNFGCLDEFWHMAALYGTLTSFGPQDERYVDLNHFTGSPLRLSPGEGWQGTCDTFVIWSQYLHTAGNNPFARLHSSLDRASVPNSGTAARPGWWDTISPVGIRAIRNSEFLFVRKFIDAPALAGGGDFSTVYAQIMLY